MNESIETELIPVDLSVMPTKVVEEKCSKCGRVFGEGVSRSTLDPTLCTKCTREGSATATLSKTDNSGWIQEAIAAGLPLWEQQPDETVDEYDMWRVYRDLWPEVRPTVTKVANTMGVKVYVVQRAFNRWSWAARLQAWIREVNADRTAELRQARRKMVEDHISIGEKLRAKASAALDNLDETDVTPNELVNLLKLTQQFEETARDAMDAVEDATARDIDAANSLFVDEGAAEQRVGNARGISREDAAEVVAILQAAGVMPQSSKVGIRQTTQTEVIVDNEL